MTENERGPKDKGTATVGFKTTFSILEGLLLSIELSLGESFSLCPWYIFILHFLPLKNGAKAKTLCLYLSFSWRAKLWAHHNKE